MRRWVFPLHELYIAIAFFALIVTGLYFLVGAWGPVLLWSLGTLFLLPMLGGVVGLFMECRSRYDARQRLAAAGVFLGAVAAAGLWLGAVGYCGYRAFHAIP